MCHKALALTLAFCSILYLAELQENAGPTPEDMCRRAQQNCKTCIQAHPLCTWCSQPTNQTKQGTRQMRCQLLSKNEKTCQDIENPLNEVNANMDEPFSNVTEGDNFANLTVIQLRPQKLDVKLRQGHPETINITFKRVIDYPLDLYYVMDLSFSMGDDLETLQRLGSDLVEGIKNLTNNVGLGFGTFVDKVMLPYTSTVPTQLKDPCSSDENAECAAVFGFRHQLPITADGMSFIDAVTSTRISGNIDSPEGGFDALMQIAVCQEKIAWRDGSLRVILFTSDASPHVAMDGKLAAILEKNDMQCHLETGVHEYYPNSSIYASSKILDYPSVGQLKKVFNEQKIQPVFAVTEDVFPLYENLRKLLDPAYADILASNSENVVALISESYNQIRSKIQLNQPNLPNNVKMAYRALCPDAGGTWAENSLECDNVPIGSEVIFQFDIESRDCPEGLTSDSIELNSNSIQDTVTFNIDYLCDCDCVNDRKENHTSCSHKGSLECGICACDPGILGLQCQCTESMSGTPLEQNCTADIYQPGSPLCNGEGFCECGKCQCNSGFYGTFCECRDSGCPEDIEGLVCGGPTRGTCENCNDNPQCNCEGNWRPDDNGLCNCNDMRCRENETATMCSGFGSCPCDRCVCDDFHEGSFCQRCVHPNCVGFGGTCSSVEIRECAECVYNAERLNQAIVDECNEECVVRRIKFQVVDSLPDCNNCLNGIQEEICTLCNTFSRDPSVHVPISCESNPFSNCILQYRIVWDITQQQYAVFVKEFEQEDCPTVDPLTIVLPVVGGILFVGIVALIIWKIIQTLRDKHEYQRFMQETSKAKWSAGQSQLYVNPNARVQNPMFVGN